MPPSSGYRDDSSRTLNTSGTKRPSAAIAQIDQRARPGGGGDGDPAQAEAGDDVVEQQVAEAEHATQVAGAVRGHL